MILEFLLDRPFIPDFIPAVGDIDAFIRVPRPDSQPEVSKDVIHRFGSLFGEAYLTQMDILLPE
jgi:hypothetical protein